MRRKVNIKIPSSDLDYGKKPYGSATAYQGQARKASAKLEHDQVLRQYSEFKRPQGNHDSYQDMEYWADPPPGFVFPDFTVPDWPGVEYPVPEFEWGDTFLCACLQPGCYCPGETKCFDAGCTYPIIGAQVVGGGGTFSVSSGGKGRICITASEDAKLSADLFITLQKLKPNGKGGVTLHGTCVVKKLYSKCSDSECCAGTEDIAWDSEASAETVGRNTSCVVAITDAGDGTPYTWTVSGTGFWLNEGHSATSLKTDLTSINLYTDDTACGTATITVHGCLGTSVTGYVKCTYGEWILIESVGTVGSAHTVTLYEHPYKYIEDHYCCDHEACETMEWADCPTDYVYPCNDGPPPRGDKGCHEGYRIYEWGCES